MSYDSMEVSSINPRRVLLVGLEPTLAVTLADHLQREGWTVRRAVDGRDAVRSWHEKGAPTVVTDLDGGGMDAFDLFEAAELPQQPHVVLCTPHALAEELDPEALALLGIGAVVRTPCPPAAIARALAAVPRPAVHQVG
ncbi:MAG: hypothetical protein ACJ8D5_04970 [Sphingomicrobium sp.]